MPSLAWIALGLTTMVVIGSLMAAEPDDTGAKGTALAAVATLEVKGRSAKTGYTRDQFGQTWFDADRNGCDTRNDILRRDLTATVVEDCVVLSGTLDDPYTGVPIPFAHRIVTPARTSCSTPASSR